MQKNGVALIENSAGQYFPRLNSRNRQDHKGRSFFKIIEKHINVERVNLSAYCFSDAIGEACEPLKSFICEVSRKKPNAKNEQTRARESPKGNLTAIEKKTTTSYLDKQKCKSF